MQDKLVIMYSRIYSNLEIHKIISKLTAEERFHGHSGLLVYIQQE